MAFARKKAKILHDNCPKNIFPENLFFFLGGGGMCPLQPRLLRLCVTQLINRHDARVVYITIGQIATSSTHVLFQCGQAARSSYQAFLSR